MSNRIDLFVIGAGVAGMTAAEQASRRGLKVALAEETMFGGLVMNVNHLDPRPEHMAASGSDLAAEMMTSAADLGAEILMTPVISLDRLPSGEIRVETADGAHLARCALIASGARLRKLNVPGEQEFEHRGVSQCADCDGPLFRGQAAVVVGGGDSALQEAAVLSEFCPTVHLVHRRSAFSAREKFVSAVMANPRVSVHFDTVVEAIEGEDSVASARLRNVASGETKSVPCRGFFAFVGLEPNTGFLPPAIEKERGHIRVNEKLETSLEGVYAIGAVRAGYTGDLTAAIEDATRAVEAAHVRLTQM